MKHKMKIIISHDVDHLYASDHYLKDLIIPKLLVRSLIHFCVGKLKFSTLISRISLLFTNKMTGIDEMIKFDKENNIPSIFFFGMSNGLGMSYNKKKAIPWIKKVMDNNFDVGVHGIEFENFDLIKKEHDDFKEITGMDNFGIRNHYVRFNACTFDKMDKAGYIFDSTWFNKKVLEIRNPYKIGKMWEFPLHIMDAYVCFPGKLEQGIRDTIDTIKLAEQKNSPYCTILAHDMVLNERYSPELSVWYRQIVKFLQENEYEFISYREAIKELEGKNENNTLC